MWGVVFRRWWEVQSGEVRLATRLSHCGEVQRAHGFVREQRVRVSEGVMKQTVQACRQRAKRSWCFVLSPTFSLSVAARLATLGQCPLRAGGGGATHRPTSACFPPNLIIQGCSPAALGSHKKCTCSCRHESETIHSTARELLGRVLWCGFCI